MDGLTMNTVPHAFWAPGASGPAAETAKQFITFTLGAEEYGVDIMQVREVKGWTEATVLPNSPHYMRGVINLRGVIVPILDLRARFGMGATASSPLHVVIIVVTASRLTGLLVDAVSDIISVEGGAVRPVPEMGPSAGECFLGGLVAHGERMVALVSLDGLIGAAAGRDAEGDL